MDPNNIHSYLVHAGKGADPQPPISGTEVSSGGRLHEMLVATFLRSFDECNIDIIFRRSATGEAVNPARDVLTSYVTAPSVATGRDVAVRLQASTTKRSGLGLVFLMSGSENGTTRLVVARFPADTGITATETESDLTVEFLERVFMKSAYSYKSALYTSTSDYHLGRAVDRQVKGPKELSDYWIRDFLDSELATTGAAGTKRIAVALRNAVQESEELAVRQELIAASTILRGFHGTITSGNELVARLHLSQKASDALSTRLPRSELMDDQFQFDGDEFSRHVSYRMIELDNGAVLIADAENFEDIFTRADVAGSDDQEEEFSTRGHVQDERLRNRR